MLQSSDHNNLIVDKIMNNSVLITGASRGIGLSFSKLYQQRGFEVYATCRNSSSELDALGVNVIDGIDVSKPESIKKLTNALENRAITHLINNAGILRYETLGSIDYQSIEAQFATNALGPLRVTEALVPNLKPNSDGIARVALITSRMGSITDNTSGGRYGYRMSKAALNIAGVSLAHDLHGNNVAVGIFHPGLVGTDMIGGHGDITPDEAASRIIGLLENLNLDNSGTFWHSNGERLPW